MTDSRTDAPVPFAAGPAPAERGFALFSVLAVTMIVAVVLTASMRTTELTERLSGSSIQRSRAFNAAEGALMLGERRIADSAVEGVRSFASADGSDGIFSFAGVDAEWWRDQSFDGATGVAPGTFVGVAAAPEHVVEEVGNYVADGGSGIVSLDRGAGSYGRRTGSGRELVLYRVQSRGNGSSRPVQAVVESLFVQPN